MDNNSLKCMNNNNCSLICNVKDCDKIPFMCNDEQCLCYSFHQNCKTSIKGKKFKEMFSAKLKKRQSKYMNQIEELYKSILKKIQKSLTQTKMLNTSGLNQIQQKIFVKIKQKDFVGISGSLINQFQAKYQIIPQPIYSQCKLSNNQKAEIQNQTQKLVRMLQNLLRLKPRVIQNNIGGIIKIVDQPKFQSTITNDVQCIQNLFDKKIKAIDLLYRASQNNFQTNQFWEKCNGKSNTLIILKTQFDKIIGGYTPLSWKQNHKGYEKDYSKQSFLFSITQFHKLPLLEGKQDKAIQHDSGYGPAFGGGSKRDLIIWKNANVNRSSACNPGSTYNNGEYIQSNQQSWEKFSGQSVGRNFYVKEWQAHQIVFE